MRRVPEGQGREIGRDVRGAEGSWLGPGLAVLARAQAVSPGSVYCIVTSCVVTPLTPLKTEPTDREPREPGADVASASASSTNVGRSSGFGAQLHVMSAEMSSGVPACARELTRHRRFDLRAGPGGDRGPLVLVDDLADDLHWLEALPGDLAAPDLPEHDGL